jgi:LysM repeat protein
MPAPTPELNLTFATLTPGPEASVESESQTQVTRPAPTATVTATPVLYIVRAGDTLVGIAAANGVMLDELLTLNPDVQPELLMVGQELLLPPLPTAVAPVAIATNQPESLEISGLTPYSSISGGIWVMGEVYNTGQQPTELVRVEVTLLDSATTEFGKETLWLTPVTLPAGGKAPFGVLFQDVDLAQARAKAEIVGGRPVYELGNRYLDLAVSDAQVTIGRSPIEVVGRLENVGQQPAGQISVITTLYDDRGVVTGFHELALDGVIQPGESVSFQFIALPPGGRVDGYDFAVQAIIAESLE